MFGLRKYQKISKVMDPFTNNLKLDGNLLNMALFMPDYADKLIKRALKITY